MKVLQPFEEVSELEALLSAEVAERKATERRLRDEALAESESKYRMLMDQTSDAVLIFDRQGAIVEVNPKMSEMFGYNEEELLRMSLRDLILSEDLASFPVRLTELLAGKIVHRQRRLRRKDGTLFQVKITGSMVAPNRMLAIIRDAADRKRSEAHANGNGQDMADEVFSSIKARLINDISTALASAAEAMGQAYISKSFPDLESSGGIDFYDEVSRFEAGLIQRALKQAGGKQKEAARLLGVKQTTLHAMLKRHKIKPGDLEDDAAQ